MKYLIIYFSRADENYFAGQIRNINKGNTEVIADYIKDITNADTFKVIRKIPYSKDYHKCTQEALDEQRKNEHPELVDYLTDISSYDVIFIGTPIYWGTFPQPLFTELEKLDFRNKIIMPFATHEGSGLGNIINDLNKIAKGATIKPGLAIVGSNVNSARNIVESWIKNNL